MKFKRSFLVLAAVLAIAPMVITLCFYSSLPDEIIMQWGINGNPDYREKIQLIIMSALPLVIAPLMLITPKIDPKRANYKHFGSAYQGVVLVILLFLLEMTCIVISEALLPGKISVYSVVTITVGLLFVFIGNLLPKVKSNFYIGFRTPWTISDSDVWFKTNRIGGYMMFTAGILICFIPFVLPETAGFITLVALVMISTFVPMIMSYIWYRAKSNKNNA